jgi:hypothetical protein
MRHLVDTNLLKKEEHGELGGWGYEVSSSYLGKLKLSAPVLTLRAIGTRKSISIRCVQTLLLEAHTLIIIRTASIAYRDKRDGRMGVRVHPKQSDFNSRLLACV